MATMMVAMILAMMAMMMVVIMSVIMVATMAVEELTKPRLLIFGSLHHCVARFPAKAFSHFLSSWNWF